MLKIIGDTLTAFSLDKSDKWGEAFTDGTSRRQISVQDFVAGFLEGKELNPPVLFPAILLEDETSERKVEYIMEKDVYVV